MITPVIIHRLQWKAYLIFMVTNLVFMPIIYFIYPETSNLALEEVDYIFADGGNPVTVAASMQKELKQYGRLELGRRMSRVGLGEDDKQQEEKVENVEFA